MKRWLLFVASICFISLLIIFILIPSKKEINHTVKVKSTSAAVSRFLINDNWSNWWPGKIIKASAWYEYKGFDYRINKKLLNGFQATITHENHNLPGSLAVLPDGDSSKFVWSGMVTFSKNPVSRVMQYFTLLKFEKNINHLLNDLSTYFSDEQNVYGEKVRLININETPLVSTEVQFTHYPSVDEIYEVIGNLKKFISGNKGTEMGYPMMHVYTDDSVNYALMVAIQTQRALQPSGEFKLKRLVMGKMLTMDVQGGPGKIQQQQVQLKNYLHDHNKLSPAIPYQLLITDRKKEPDTAKWITRLHYPVF